jgi:hypothetical protein
MTPDDAFERQLESFRPRPPSPELHRLVGARLARRRRRRLGFALAAAAVLGGVALGLIFHRGPAPRLPADPAPPQMAAVPPPSVLAYREAFSRSPAALDSLLDEQAVNNGGNVFSAQPAYAGIVPNLMAWKGSRE